MQTAGAGAGAWESGVGAGLGGARGGSGRGSGWPPAGGRNKRAALLVPSASAESVTSSWGVGLGGCLALNFL